MKTKLRMNRILTVLSIILILALPILSIISIKPVFAADVTLPFSDGFETGDFSKWSNTPGGSVTSGSAYNGTYKAVFSSSYIQATFSSAPVDQCFMRAYVWLNTTVNTGASTSIFGLYKSGGYYMAEAGVANVAGTLKWTLRYFDSNGTTDVSHTVVSELYKPILGKWYCVEVEGKDNSATDAEARIYIDGNELTDVTQTRLNNTQQINCGYIWISNPGSGATIWYDDVGIATSYIGPEEAGQTYTLSVSINGQGSVETDRSPPYYYGDLVQLTAVPELGWSLSSWAGDLGGSTNPVTILIDGNKTVTATFTLSTYTLTVSTVGSGSVTLNNSGPYQYGDVVKLTAVPASYWFFKSWSGDLSGTTNPATILIDRNKTVTATFNSTRIFEDGFESGNFSKWSATGGSPSVTSGDAHHGTYKAVLTSSQYAQARFTDIDDCFMRAYVMFKAFPAAGTEVTVLGVYSYSPSRYMAEARVINVGGIVKWRMRYYDNGTYYYVNSELQKPVLDTWYCVEVEGKSNSTTDAESRMWINGTILNDITQTGKNNTLQITCGYIWVNSAGTQWYDCAVLGTAYIGPETVHDIAVTKVTSHKQVIFESCFAGNVTTTIANNGDSSENVNVTVTATNIIGTQFTIGSFTNVPVNNGTSVDLTLTWNTTTFVRGNYTLFASADAVPGETNTADNNFTDGWVLLTRQGDLNGDNRCDGRDLLIQARAFGSYGPDYYYPGSPATPGWNPNADVDNDGKVDGRDLLIVSRHFGEG